MAEMIARLKVDSSEYDAKIQRAAKGIQHLAEECHNAGGILNVLEDENREYIKSLGNMATVATTTRGKIAELTSGFIDIKSVYNSLSQEEKNGEFGKELNRQLDIMKQRIQAAKGELKDIDKELGSTGGFMDQLAQKFTVNIDAIKLFNIGLKAADAALKVAKDAFMSSEANVDEWGRTMEASEALYEGFLNALNRSDVSGFLSRMDDIVKAAREAYNALDELSTYKVIQGPENARRNAEEQRLRTMLRTGKYIAPTDGRQSSYGLKQGDALTSEARAGYQRALDNLMKKTISETQREIGKTNKAVDKLYNEIAGKSGISRADFKNTITNWDTYQATFSNVQKFNDWNAENVPVGIKLGANTAQGRGIYDLYVAKNNPYYNARTLAWRDFRDSGDKFAKAQGLAETAAGLSAQLYGTEMRNYRALNAGGGGRGGGGTGGGGAGGGAVPYVPLTKSTTNIPIAPFIFPTRIGDEERGYWAPNMNAKELADWKSKMSFEELSQWQTSLGQEAQWKSAEQAQLLKQQQLAANGGLQGKIEPIDMDDFIKQFQEAMANSGTTASQKEKAWEDFADISDNMSKMTSGMSQLVSGVQQLGIKVPSGITKMLSMLQGITTILTAIETMQQVGTWLGLFNKGGVVRAASGYQVPGNYGYDAVPALLTSGETVLTKSQTAGLARRLQQQGESNYGTPTARISGEQIYIALTNYMNRRGYGETLISR